MDAVYCFNEGNITGNDVIGGIAGSIGSIAKYCGNKGRIKGNEMVGGVVGVSVNYVNN